MSNKTVFRKHQITLILLGSIIVLIGFLYCIGAFAVEQNFQDWELMITENDLPAGWKTSEIYKSMNESEGQESGATFTWGLELENKNPRMMEKVYRYSSEYQAYRKFYQFSETYLGSSKDEDLNYLKGYDLSQLRATVWDFGCLNLFPSSDSELLIDCSFLAQYDEFVINFSVHVKKNDYIYISSDDLYAVIIRIDEKISSYLNE